LNERTQTKALLKEENKAQEQDIRNLKGRLAEWEAKYPKQADEFIEAKLERDGVTVVTNSEGMSHGLVASVPDSKFDFAGSHLQKQRIVCFGPCGRGQCGVYVPVRDFHKAAELLREIKPQLQKRLKADQRGRVWIWEKPIKAPKGDGRDSNPQ
jgi:hypothetical protein